METLLLAIALATILARVVIWWTREEPEPEVEWSIPRWNVGGTIVMSPEKVEELFGEGAAYSSSSLFDVPIITTPDIERDTIYVMSPSIHLEPTYQLWEKATREKDDNPCFKFYAEHFLQYPQYPPRPNIAKITDITES